MSKCPGLCDHVICFVFESKPILFLKPLLLTSIPVPGPVCVYSLCSAVACAVDVFVFRAVRPPEHFAGRSDI